MNSNQSYRRPSGTDIPSKRRPQTAARSPESIRKKKEAAKRREEERRNQLEKTVFAVFVAIGIIALLVLLIGMGRGTARSGRYVPENIGNNSAAVSVKTLDKAKFAVICIDPGYGYSEKGMSTGYAEEKYGLNEAETALKFALALQDRLSSLGYTVVLTHDTNEIPEDESSRYKLTASERAEFANSEGASLLISLHTREESSKKQGMVVYYRSADASAKLLAETVAPALDETLTYSETDIRSLTEEEAYNILLKTNAPSLLIDIANMNNEEDADRLYDDGWYREASIAMSKGIMEYLSKTVTD